jgi:hypothetical protein
MRYLLLAGMIGARLGAAGVDKDDRPASLRRLKVAFIDELTSILISPGLPGEGHEP